VQIVAALEQAWDAVLSLVAPLDAAGWDTPSPLPGWTIGDITAHLAHIEGMVHGFDQPSPPEEYDPAAFEGLSVFTEAGVAARRAWERDDVLAELRSAVAATLDAARSRTESEWQAPTWSPVGTVPAATAAEIRLADVYTHLLDMRIARGLPLDATSEPAASGAVVERAIRLAGWGAVKGAGLGDGARVRLDLSGPGGASVDLVVEAGRGRIEPASDPPPSDVIEGRGMAFLLAVGGRSPELAGGLEVTGPTAARLLDGYRLFV
jgi:uncharacterized protein (TIGR03083 family)